RCSRSTPAKPLAPLVLPPVPTRRPAWPPSASCRSFAILPRACGADHALGTALAFADFCVSLTGRSRRPPARERHANGGFRMTSLGLLIDNQDVQATGGASFERRNPLDGQVATTAAAASVEDGIRAA